MVSWLSSAGRFKYVVPPRPLLHVSPNAICILLQIIHDLTEGRVPKFWRPPTGDMDNRVRAIAREVFGLTRTSGHPAYSLFAHAFFASRALELRHRGLESQQSDSGLRRSAHFRAPHPVAGRAQTPRPDHSAARIDRRYCRTLHQQHVARNSAQQLASVAHRSSPQPAILPECCQQRWHRHTED